ncbi:MAG: DUF2332 domain-containing protein [Gammaproteobacteria bacterium]
MTADFPIQTATPDTRAEFERWVGFYAAMHAPLYAALSGGVAGDPDLIDIAARTRKGQPIAPTLFNAVHYLLLADPDHPLGRWYASIEEHPRDPSTAFAPFRAYCLERRDRIVEIVATRTTQATTVERAAVLMLAFARVQDATGTALSIIEMGCSAGFNLLFDRYRHEFTHGADALPALGDPDSPVVLRPRMIHARAPLPARMPEVAVRVGVDLAPVDPHDPDTRRWMQALHPPEFVDTVRNIERAFAVRRAYPLRVLRGDAVELVGPLIDEIPGPVCVLHSNCLYQWPEAPRQAVERILRDAGARRPVHRISMEPDFNAPARILERFPPGSSIHSELIHTLYDGGRREQTLLGYVDGHARWIDWLA